MLTTLLVQVPWLPFGALVVGIGRACDTGDWVTNSIGAVIGGMLALAALALAQRRARAAA